MLEVEINEAQIIRQNKAFARLLVSDKETRKRIRKVIREELKEKAKILRKDAADAMKSDPRKAYRAVQYSLYRKILGGNLHILNSRKAGARYELIKERKLDRNPHQRGGNRIPRSKRTADLETYYGKDRGFILRFISSGTKERSTKYGNRGSISGNHWFQDAAPVAMNSAAENLSKVIEEELAEAYKEGII